MIALLVCYAVAFVFLIVTTYCTNLQPYRILAKFTISTTFIIIGIYCALASDDPKYYAMLFPAFFLCLVGDVLLAFKDAAGSKKYLLYGMAAFLLGHVGFVLAWNILTPMHIYEVIFPVCAVIITFFVLHMRKMDAGNMRIYAIVYSFFVAFLFSKGTAVLVHNPGNGSLLIFFGSLLFLISDAIILFLYFFLF